jgi:hypothetical protein
MPWRQKHTQKPGLPSKQVEAEIPGQGVSGLTDVGMFSSLANLQ